MIEFLFINIDFSNPLLLASVIAVPIFLFYLMKYRQCVRYEPVEYGKHFRRTLIAVPIVWLLLLFLSLKGWITVMLGPATVPVTITISATIYMLSIEYGRFHSSRKMILFGNSFIVSIFLVWFLAPGIGDTRDVQILSFYTVRQDDSIMEIYQAAWASSWISSVVLSILFLRAVNQASKIKIDEKTKFMPVQFYR